MLLKMLPEQINTQWEIIRPAIEEAMPHEYVPDERYMTNVLESLLSDKMHCWLIVDGEDVKALCVTNFVVDPGGEQSLFIYALYGYKPVPLSMWTNAFESLGKWAKRYNCAEVIAFTDSGNEGVLRIVGNLGGSADRVVVRIPVNSNGGI